MFAVGHNFSVLMLSRVIGGMSAGMVMPGVTGLIADISPSHQKAKNFGYMSAIINSGFILGPGIGGFMAEVSHRMPFYFAGALGILAFIMSIVLIHDPKSLRQVVSKKLEPQLLTKINWKVFITPVILTLVLSFGLSAFETLYSLYTADKVNYSPKDISIAITGGGIFVLFQIYFFDKFMKYFSELTFIAWSLLYSVVVLILLVFANGYWSIGVNQFCCLQKCFDMIRPAITNYF